MDKISSAPLILSSCYLCSPMQVLCSVLCSSCGCQSAVHFWIRLLIASPLINTDQPFPVITGVAEDFVAGWHWSLNLSSDPSTWHKQRSLCLPWSSFLIHFFVFTPQLSSPLFCPLSTSPSPCLRMMLCVLLQFSPFPLCGCFRAGSKPGFLFPRALCSWLLCFSRMPPWSELLSGVFLAWWSFFS